MITGSERTYGWEDPIALARAGTTMSGLDFLTACADGRLPPPPALVTAGIHPVEFSDGRAVFVKINFTRAVTVESGRLRGEGTVVTIGRRTATSDARITDAAGRLVAHASTTCLIFE